MSANNDRKVALITGGSKGIGYGVAKKLLQQGYAVAITSRSQISADKAAKQLKDTTGGNVLGLEADVRNHEAQQHTIEKIIEKWGKLDIVIANAGLGHFGSIEDLTTEQWHEVIDINLTGVFYTVKSSIDELKKSKGYLITIASLAGTNFFAGGAIYNASKFGLVGFTQAVMLDLRKHDIKVTTIMPGSVATHFNDHEPGPEDDWKIQPDDIGQMVVDLLNMAPNTLPSKVEVRPSKPPS